MSGEFPFPRPLGAQPPGRAETTGPSLSPGSPRTPSLRAGNADCELSCTRPHERGPVHPLYLSPNPRDFPGLLSPASPPHHQWIPRNPFHRPLRFRRVESGAELPISGAPSQPTEVFCFPATAASVAQVNSYRFLQVQTHPLSAGSSGSDGKTLSSLGNCPAPGGPDQAGQREPARKPASPSTAPTCPGVQLPPPLQSPEPICGRGALPCPMKPACCPLGQALPGGGSQLFLRPPALHL